MARHTGGWVKIYRSLVNGDIGNNPYRFTLFSKLIGWANLQETWVEWNGKPRRCPRGSLVTSTKELAEAMGCARSSVNKQLSYLQLRGSLKVEKSTGGLFVEIPNYEEYQSQDAEGRHERDNSATTAQQTHDNSATHNEELKNKRKKESTRTVVGKPTPVQIDSAEELLSLIDEKRMVELKALYPDEGFVEREAIKAVQYYRDNPRKQPKTDRGWKTAFASWLSRGWKYHVKTIPGTTSRVPAEIDWSRYKDGEAV